MATRPAKSWGASDVGSVRSGRRGAEYGGKRRGRKGETRPAPAIERRRASADFPDCLSIVCLTLVLTSCRCRRLLSPFRSSPLYDAAHAAEYGSIRRRPGPAVGSAGRFREKRDRPQVAKTSGAARAASRVAIWAIATLALVVVTAGSWWIITDHHRPASDPTACQSIVEDAWVRGGRECLHFEEFRSPSVSEHPDLVVVLHGDAPFSRPGYQYSVARRLSSQVENIIAVGLLRPGYTDDEGHRSSGIRGRAIGDNYTAADVDAITSAVTALVETYLPGRVFLVGHSGGAAIVADMIARHPGIAAGVMLVSCPCDVPAWRHHMDSTQHAPIWRVPVLSLSPLTLAAQVDTHTVVRVVVGSADNVTPLAFSRPYVQRLTARGVHADLVQLKGAGHDILLDPRVMREITSMLGAVSGS